MHGKVIGFNLTDVATWPLLELNNFSTPSVWMDPTRPWRTAACQALGIPVGHIAEDTHIDPSEGSKFTLSPDAYLSSEGQLQRKTLLM